MRIVGPHPRIGLEDDPPAPDDDEALRPPFREEEILVEGHLAMGGRQARAAEAGVDRLRERHDRSAPPDRRAAQHLGVVQKAKSATSPDFSVSSRP